MSFTFVQSASAQSNGGQNSVEATFESAVTSGNIVVVMASAAATSTADVPLTISDNIGGNTYVSVGTAVPQEGTSPYFYRFQGSFATIAETGTGPNSFTVTSTPSRNTFLNISISEWSFTDPYVVPASEPNSSVVQNSPANVGAIGVAGNCLVIADFIQYATNALWTPGSGYTAIQNTAPTGNTIGTIVEYLANTTSSPANPGASVTGALGSCFGFALKESQTPYSAVDLNYYVSKWGMLVVALTDPVPSSTGVYPIENVTAVNANPTALVNGHAVTLNGPCWPNETTYTAFVGYWMECGAVASITMSAGGANYTSPSASWSSGSGGGTSLSLGTPVLAVGITSYTIVSAGSGMTNGTYQWLLPGTGTYTSPATALVTVSGGLVTACVPICGSVFGMGALYSGTTLSGNSFNLAGGTAATITANISNYVQSIPVVSSSHDFTSQPTITITDLSGTGAIAAPIMSGPAPSDTITMSLSSGALGCSLGTSSAFSNVAVTNWVGQTEGATGHLQGFAITPTMPAGGDVGSEMVGGVSSHFLAKYKQLTANIWTGAGITYDSNWFPVSGTPGATLSQQIYTEGNSLTAVKQGAYTIIYDDAFYGSGAPAATPFALSTAKPGNTILGSPSTSRSGTTVTVMVDVTLRDTAPLCAPTYDIDLYANFTLPSDGLWHITNFRVLAPGNTDTWATNVYDCDDNVIAALTGPGGETPGCLRFMDNFYGGGGSNNYILPTDLPAYGTMNSWLLPQLYTAAINISSVRTLNTNPGDGTRTWNSTKLYVWQNWLPTESDSFGNYIDMTAGPLGVNDMGNIVVANTGVRGKGCIIEFVCETNHNFRTLDTVVLTGTGSGYAVDTSVNGEFSIFPAANGGGQFQVFVTGPTTFFIGYYDNNFGNLDYLGGNVIQTLLNTSPVSTPGLTVFRNLPEGGTESPPQFGANMVSRLPGTAMWVNLSGVGSTAWHQAHMQWIAPYFLDNTNEIWLEYGNEHWNTGFNLYAILGEVSNWTAYVPSGSSCFGGVYTSSGVSLYNGGADALYALSAAQAFQTCLAELVSLGISESRIKFIYGSAWSFNNVTQGVAGAIETYSLPLGTLVIAPYTGNNPDSAVVGPWQPAGYPGAGNWPVQAICDWVRHANSLSPNNWSTIGGHVQALTPGLQLGAYEGGITSPIPTNVIHGPILTEDLTQHPAWADAVKGYYLLQQLGNPTIANGGMVFSNIYTIWYQSPVAAGQPVYRIAQGPAQQVGLGDSNLYFTPQGGPGADGSHLPGYAPYNQAPGVKALLDWNGTIDSGPTSTATLSGPTSGSVGVASTNFTVTLNGSSYTGTVTPSDSSAGGTFTPTSLSWSGTAGSQTFTYTPSVTGSISISISASPTLTISGSPITYTSGAATTTATLSGPTSGRESVASTNFTVTLNGTSYTGTVTPSDGGGGGTFTPSSLTWSGTAGSKTFTYTPVSAGTKSISISASPTLAITGSPATYVATPASTIVTLTGPTSGFVNTASTNFTVTLNASGYVGTVTPSNAGGSGTFTPSVLSFNGTTASGTFTYAPTSAGPVPISITPNPTLTVVGSPITYTASELSTAHYVANSGSNTNSGNTSSSPWKTLAYAVAQSKPGDTILLNGDDTFDENVSSSVGLTIASYGSGRPTVSGTVGSPTIEFINCDGITLSNLAINNGSSTAGASHGVYLAFSDGVTHSKGATIQNCVVTNAQFGIFVYLSNLAGSLNNITISGNTISGCGQCGVFIGSSGSGQNYSGVNVSGNKIHSISGFNTSGSSGVGIVMGNCGSSASRCFVQQNLVYSCGYNAEGYSLSGPAGIMTFNCDAVVFEQNVVHDIYASLDHNQDGVGIYGANGSGTNLAIEGNVAYNCQGAGILFSSAAAAGSLHAIAFNLIVNCGTTNESGIAIVRGATGAANIFNNTVLQQTGTNPALVIDATADSANKGIYNNILVTPTGVTTVSLPTSATGFALEGNAYLSGTSFNATYTSTAYTSLASWRTATSQESKPHGFALTANPCLAPSPIPSNITPSNIVAASVYGVTGASGLGTAGLNLSSLYEVTLPSTDLLGRSLNAKSLPVGAVNNGVAPKKWFPGLLGQASSARTR